MPTDFTVVGEHREDKTQLLVIGADGQYYRYNPVQELIAPVEPDESWVLQDAQAPHDPDAAPADLDMV